MPRKLRVVRGERADDVTIVDIMKATGMTASGIYRWIREGLAPEAQQPRHARDGGREAPRAYWSKAELPIFEKLAALHHFRQWAARKPLDAGAWLVAQQARSPYARRRA